MTSGLVSHWEHGAWAHGETRLHWYLLPSSVPAASVDAVASLLGSSGFDLVPANWLHCTVVSLVPSLISADRSAVDHMVDAVRSSVDRLARITASASLAAYHSAVVWQLEPADAFRGVFDSVVTASTSMLRTDPSRPYRPHLTVAYANAPHDDSAVSRIVDDRSGDLEQVEFATLSLLDVRQEAGCYRWEIVEEIPLGGHLPEA